MNTYKELESLRRRATQIIDTNWHYSWHWGKNEGRTHWTMDAKHDCIRRIYEVEEELKKLKQIRKELEIICPRYYPKKEE